MPAPRVPSPCPTPHARTDARLPRRGSRVGATYSLPLDALSAAERADEQARLTLQAKCSFGAPPPVQVPPSPAVTPRRARSVRAAEGRAHAAHR